PQRRHRHDVAALGDEGLARRARPPARVGGGDRRPDRPRRPPPRAGAGRLPRARHRVRGAQRVSLAAAGARSGAVEAVGRIINREGAADVILRAAVATLAERLGPRWAGIAFVEDGTLVLGPVAGDAPPAPERPAVVAPVEYRGAVVAELWLDHDAQADA